MQRSARCHRFATIQRGRAIFLLPAPQVRLLQWRHSNAMEAVMKMLAEFSLAAAAALAIGIGVGGAAFSLVWLITVLDV